MATSVQDLKESTKGEVQGHEVSPGQIQMRVTHTPIAQWYRILLLDITKAPSDLTKFMKLHKLTTFEAQGRKQVKRVTGIHALSL